MVSEPLRFLVSFLPWWQILAMLLFQFRPPLSLLRYAFAELEESRGAIQAARKLYQSLLGDNVNTTTLAHIQVEQRRKEALSKTVEKGPSALEGSLQDVVSRYSFMDLWPCSSKDLDLLVRQEWLVKNINKKVDKSAFSNGSGTADKGPSGITSNSTTSAEVIYPDTSKMVIYDPRQKPGSESSPSEAASRAAHSTLSNPMVAVVGGGTISTFDEILKATPPALVSFLANLPAVEGPTPNVDFVLSICLQSDILRGQAGKSGIITTQIPAVPAPTTSDFSGSNKSQGTSNP